MTSAYTIACHRCGTLVDLDDIDECGSCIACAERLRTPSALEVFLADDRALETVEVAIAAGVIVAGLVLVILAIGAFVRGSLGELLRGAKAGGSP